MSLPRWLLTFLAFPLAGLVSMVLLGGVRDPLTAVTSGAIVGASVGTAQWFALGRLAGSRWIVLTAAAVAAGALVSFPAVGAPVTTPAAVVTGLVTGLALGISQGVALRRGWRVTAIWTITVALSWGLGWFVTSLVIVDLVRGHAVFGSSGAAVVTILTGIVLRVIVGPRRERARPSRASEAEDRVRAS